MQETTNFKLKKPDYTDVADIADINENMEVIDEAIKVLQEENEKHTANVNNPHEVTKAQVGLGNVNNTSDLNKPISVATQAALNGKAAINHTHSLSNNNITDVLPIVKGGTGTSEPDITDGALLIGDSDFFCVSVTKPSEKSYVTTTNAFTPKWETADTVPTQGSEKLITSGGLYNCITKLSNILYVKSSNTSENLIKKISGNNNVFSSLETAISNAYEGCEIVLLPGSYSVSSVLNINVSGIVIRGLSCAVRDITVINTSISNAIRLQNQNNVVFKNLNINEIGGTGKTQSVALYNSHHITFENVRFKGIGIFLGFKTPNTTTAVIYENISILNCIMTEPPNIYSNQILNARILNNYILSRSNIRVQTQSCIDNSFILCNNVEVVTDR